MSNKFRAINDNVEERFHQPSEQTRALQAKTGILLTNLGTPDAPTPKALRRYLKEFLSDPRVIEVPRLLWWLILNGVILRIRPKKSAAAYKSVWSDEGSPLLVISQRQCAAVQQAMGDKVAVKLGMRYGNPSIASALREFQAAGIRKIVVLPLYPQYAGATTGSTFDAVADELKTWRWVPELHFINSYVDNPLYIHALAQSVQEHINQHGMPDRILFSYHGTPKRYLTAGDPYHCLCHKTTRLVCEKLGLAEDTCMTTFQSRFGREEWLQPYTDKVLEELPAAGVKTIAILSPAFSADCLETLEELEVENREVFMHAGGESYHYIPALNDRADHIAALVDVVRSGRSLSNDKEQDERVAQRTAELENITEILAKERNLMRTLVDAMPDNIFAKDTQSRFLLTNKAAAEFMGSTPENLLGKNDFDIYPQDMAQCFFDDDQAVIHSQKPLINREEPCLNSNTGEVRWLSTSKVPIWDDTGAVVGLVGIGHDITRRKQSEERVLYLATHDSLTNLPNRAMFSEMLTQAISSAQRYKRQLAVLFIDLDRFKNINDTLGHEAGDLLLQEMSARLRQCLRASDVVARLGGDEFVILVQDVDEPHQVSNVAQKILSSTIKPMTIMGQECRVTASIGICMYPNDALDEQTLMKHADIAMYCAKEEGKNNYQFYSAEIKAQSLERLTLENNLRRALERDEFFLLYQAKRDLQKGGISGVEALLRWEHPELGVVAPTQFLPLAEETGLIVLIGRWVLRTACAQNVAWQQQGMPPLRMAVNLSARQFYDEELTQNIAQALEESGMAPGLLEMEITEGMVMQNAARAIEILCAIKDMGVRLAIDDFGVGYSSLAQIRRFPIDSLKIDSSLIRDITQSSEDRAVTEAIIAMGKTLSLTVVAEGVETIEQETYLRDNACDESQGFYFSRPITPEEFANLMRLQLPEDKPHGS